METLKTFAGIIVTNPSLLLHEGTEYGRVLYHIRVPGDIPIRNGKWISFKDLVDAEGKETTVDCTKARRGSYGSLIRYELRQARQRKGGQPLAHVRPKKDQCSSKLWQLQQLPTDPDKRKAYLKHARAHRSYTMQQHYATLPWRIGYHRGRVPRQSPTDSFSIDMSGNARFQQPLDIPSALQDPSPPIKLGEFSWKPVDRRKGTIEHVSAADTWVIKLANSGIKVAIHPESLTTIDARARDKVPFRVVRANATHRAESSQRLSHGIRPAACGKSSIPQLRHRCPSPHHSGIHKRAHT